MLVLNQFVAKDKSMMTRNRGGARGEKAEKEEGETPNCVVMRCGVSLERKKRRGVYGIGKDVFCVVRGAPRGVIEKRGQFVRLNEKSWKIASRFISLFFIILKRLNKTPTSNDRG